MPKDSRRTRALQGRGDGKPAISKYAQKIERDGVPLRHVPKPTLRQIPVPSSSVVTVPHTPVPLGVLKSDVREGRGTVIKLRTPKGFGFIQPTDGDHGDNKNNVFFYLTKWVSGHVLIEGMSVSFKAVKGQQGWRATEVRSI